MDVDLLYKIALTKIPLVGAVTAKSLISYCGGVKAVFETRKKALLCIPGVGKAIADQILKQDALTLAEKELRFLEDQDIKLLFYLDEEYPSRLKHLFDCPVILYYKGNANLNHHRIVSVVGTRKPTNRGRAICEELMQELLKYDVLITSGLAYGIDVTAHKKCLDVGIQTVGVLGHGLGRIYPTEHRSIAKRMTEQGGLLTEFGIDTQPDRENFPMRNRIIAGMCDALIVVETARKGGSMITVDLANSYHRDVFAVPGRLKDPCSAGCNHAIKSHKAALIEQAKDIAYIMRWDISMDKEEKQTKLFVDFSPEEQTLLKLMQKKEEINMEQLIQKAKMSSSQLAGVLLKLEFKGKLKALPGKRFMLLN